MKLAALMEAAIAEWIKTERPECSAVTVSPEDLYPVQGNDRSSHHILNGTFRWSGYGKFADSGETAVSFDSFDTMTDCVRHGVSLVAHPALAFDVYAKSSP